MKVIKKMFGEMEGVRKSRGQGGSWCGAVESH